MKLTPDLNNLFQISENDGRGRKTSIWLSYSSTEVTYLEEVLLFDFSAIVSAVGGALGLFIGFSFLDIFKAIIDKLTR